MTEEYIIHFFTLMIGIFVVMNAAKLAEQSMDKNILNHYLPSAFSKKTKERVLIANITFLLAGILILLSSIWQILQPFFS